jgi:hypothetical protein
LFIEEKKMDISAILMQASQMDPPRAPAQNENAGAPSGRTATQAAGTGQQATPEAQMVSISSNIDYIKQHLDAVLINYPPFFPVGHPQRLDLIKGLKGIQEKVQKSALPAEVKKEVAGTQLTAQSSDGEIAAALDSLVQVKNSFTPKAGEGSGQKQPGSVVNIKI